MSEPRYVVDSLHFDRGTSEPLLVRIRRVQDARLVTQFSNCSILLSCVCVGVPVSPMYVL